MWNMPSERLTVEVQSVHLKQLLSGQKVGRNQDPVSVLASSSFARKREHV